jgi:Na+:H+ antiporter, NhaC family
MDEKIAQPGILTATTPVAILVLSLGSAVALFGDSATGGPAQIALILAGIIAGLIGIRHGISWNELEKATAVSVSTAIPAVFILLMVGALVGVWMLSGTVPYLIYWGLQIIAPEVFYFATVVICSIVAVSIGSSWTTAGTVGVALIGIAAAAGMSVEMTAGAIISGAYFGDKLSPLSDSTNLAPAVSGAELFEHIRFLLWTTVPAILIALVYFGFASMNAAAEMDQERIISISNAIEMNYNLPVWALLPALVTLGMAVFRQPAFLALISGVIAAAIVAVFIQPAVMVGSGGESGGLEAIKNIWLTAANGYESSTGHEALDNLLSRGGMESILPTVWLILSAMFFGGMMEKSGCLRTIVRYMLIGVDSGGSLMRRAGLTSLAANLIASDQYLAIVLPAQMYAEKFNEMGLKAKNLSRVVEDYGTTTSALVPWNTCGAFMASTLGVGTFAYLPYCIFNLASPVISFLYSSFNFKIEMIEDGQAAPVAETS